MESHVEKVRKVFKKNGFNDKDIYKLASVLSKLEAEVNFISKAAKANIEKSGGKVTLIK